MLARTRRGRGDSQVRGVELAPDLAADHVIPTERNSNAKGAEQAVSRRHRCPESLEARTDWHRDRQSVRLSSREESKSGRNHSGAGAARRPTLGDVRGLVGAADIALGGDAELEPAQADTSEWQRGLHGCGENEKRSERPEQHRARRGRGGGRGKEEEEGMREETQGEFEPTFIGRQRGCGLIAERPRCERAPGRMSVAPVVREARTKRGKCGGRGPSCRRHWFASTPVLRMRVRSVAGRWISPVGRPASEHAWASDRPTRVSVSERQRPLLSQTRRSG